MEKIKLLEAWKNNIFDSLSISEIMELKKKKTKTWVFNALSELERYNLLKKKKKGNLNIYRLNLDNPFLIQTLLYLESENNLNFPKLDIIVETIKSIPIKDYCLLVFGSYASDKQKESSDFDICFLVDNNQKKKKIKPYFNEVKLSHSTNIDEHYITFNEFIKMLLMDEENLGKQIFRNRILFFNGDIYYQLIKGAHKNGFRP